MPLVIWNDSLSSIIPEIDRQHKQLLEQLNALVDAMHANRGKEKINKIIQFLDLYLGEHFNLEEWCMHGYKCPSASDNDAAHIKFFGTLAEVKDELRNNGSSLSLAIRVKEQLLDWFVNQLQKIDFQLKLCMKKL